jgi:hypothetical protein
MTDLYVVTLFPFQSADEARFQFDREEDAQAFADHVNKLSDDIRGDIVDPEANPERKVTVWKSSTCESVKEAIKALAEWIVCDHEHVERDDDGRDHQFWYCNDCGQQVHPSDDDGWEVVPSE